MVAAAMAATIAARILFGPFHLGPLSVTTPLNPEGFLGLALTLLLIAGIPEHSTVAQTRWNRAMLATGVVVIAAIALRRALGVYFLSDDFILVKIGHEWNAAAFRYS